MKMNTLIQAKEICPTTTMGRINEGVLLVDVREKAEVAQLAFDVPNIMNIPFSEFEDRYQEIPKDQDIIMVCQVGERSLKTTYFLLNQGYDASKVVNMQYGLNRWVAKGFPTIGDTLATEGNGGGCCGTPAVETTKAQTSCCGTTAEVSESKCC